LRLRPDLRLTSSLLSVRTTVFFNDNMASRTCHIKCSSVCGKTGNYVEVGRAWIFRAWVGLGI
jgi:hypothetical protein